MTGRVSSQGERCWKIAAVAMACSLLASTGSAQNTRTTEGAASVQGVRAAQTAGSVVQSAGAAQNAEAVVQNTSAAEKAAPAENTGAPAKPALDRTEAVMLGSSSFNQAFGRLIESELEKTGYRVTRKGVGSAGLARPDFRDMHAILESLPVNEKTAAVLVYLGVNDGQALWLHPDERDERGRHYLAWNDPRWPALYTRRARDFFERICERGARRAIVLLPVDVKVPRLQRRLERIRRLQMRAASYSNCAVALPTAGDDGRFDSDGVARRLSDGFHMSHVGAQIVWQRISARALRLLATEPSRDRSAKLWCAIPNLAPFCPSPQTRK